MESGPVIQDNKLLFSFEGIQLLGNDLAWYKVQADHVMTERLSFDQVSDLIDEDFHHQVVFCLNYYQILQEETQNSEEPASCDLDLACTFFAKLNQEYDTFSGSLELYFLDNFLKHDKITINCRAAQES